MSETRCPICGFGRLLDLGFDGGTRDPVHRPAQRADSRQVETYSCGHIVVGGRLASADTRLDVERRRSQETVTPLPSRRPRTRPAPPRQGPPAATTQQWRTAGEEQEMSTLVRHAMTEAPKALSPDLSAGDAAGIMANFDVGAVPIIEAGDRLVGIVTDRDLAIRVLAARKDPNHVSLGEIATTDVVTVTPDTDLAHARELMRERRIRRLPVVKGGALVGILSLGDVAVASASKREVGETLGAVSQSASTAQLNDGPARGTPARARS
jgi:CBS domain-containing protein